MFIRLPKTAVQSIARGERICYVNDGKQTAPITGPHGCESLQIFQFVWFENRIAFDLGLRQILFERIGASLYNNINICKRSPFVCLFIKVCK